MAEVGRWASIIGPILGWVVLLLAAAVTIPAWIVGLVLIGVVIAAVHHAETVAHRVGEPFGTLILAVAVTIIEVGLILSLMLTNREAASTLARDTVFAAAMIILNLLLGLCLIAGSKHQREARFTRTGVTAALSTLATLMVLTLVLPNYTTSVEGPVYSATQLAFVAAVIALARLLERLRFRLVPTARLASAHVIGGLGAFWFISNSLVLFGLRP